MASDDWLCKEASSQIRGSTIAACGVASARTEDEARESAFNNAKKEFGQVCDSNSNCKEHKFTLTPERTTCDSLGKDQFKCYRLLIYAIGDEMSIHEIYEYNQKRIQDEELENRKDWNKWMAGKMTAEEWHAKYP